MRRQTMARRELAGLAAATVALGAAQNASAQTTTLTPVQASDTVTRRVVVSLPDRKLALVVNGEVVRVFPVAVGALASPSPVGRFVIVNRLSEPTYYRPGKVIAPGPSNPLGTRWLGLDRKGYGIHGTDEARSIGFARSHGCIRLRNQDVEQLFDLLRAGDVVELLGERTTDVARIFAEPARADVLPQTATSTSLSDKE